MSNENQTKADAIYEFVNIMIGAFDSGFTDHANPTLAQLHRVAQNHCKDEYGIDMPSLVEQWGEEAAADSRVKHFAVDWNSPEVTPEVPEGERKTFWVAVQAGNRQLVFIAQYVNQPFCDDGEHETLVDDNGEPMDAVGWYEEKDSCEYDSYYEPLIFNENYRLLAWAEYSPPEFSADQLKG